MLAFSEEFPRLLCWNGALKRRGQGKEHSTISFQNIYSYFFKLSMCVLEEGEIQGTQIVVLSEIPISLKAGSPGSH